MTHSEVLHERSEWDPAGLELVFHTGELKEDLRQLRERVFRDETRFLADHDIVSDDDKVGTHFCLYHNGNLAGCVVGLKAEDSSFPSRAGIPPEQVQGLYYATRFMVAPEYRKRGLSALLAYTVLREGRILDRKRAVGFFRKGDPASRVAAAEPLKQLPSLQLTGHEGHAYELHAMQVDTSYGMYRCWQRLPGELREFLAKRLLPEEVIKTVLRHTSLFFENPWFKRTAAGALTRRQYIEFLANSHQFVRWTTRILARVASLSEDSELRSHYLHHLSGEVDHEKIIEKDLAYLGADVEYIREHMFPCLDVGHFMGVQESIVGFRADPVLLLAVPIAIESLTAHAPPGFLPELEACIRSWGYDEPSRATAYLRSHIPIDGGEDGHWASTARVLAKFLKTEPDTQKFLGVARMVIVAMDRALRSYVQEPDWS